MYASPSITTEKHNSAAAAPVHSVFAAIEDPDNASTETCPKMPGDH